MPSRAKARNLAALIIANGGGLVAEKQGCQFGYHDFETANIPSGTRSKCRCCNTTIDATGGAA